MPFILGAARPPAFEQDPRIGTLLHRPHIHAGAELGVIGDGRCIFFFAGKTHTLSPGDCFFIDAVIPHGTGHVDQELFTYHYLHVSFEALISIPPPEAGLALLRTCLQPLDAGLEIFSGQHQLLESMRIAHARYQLAEPLDRAAAWGQAVNMMTTVAALRKQPGDAMKISSGTESDSATLAGPILEAVQYIHEHFQEPLTLKSVAVRCSLSVSQLCEKFAVSMNHSPIQYRNKIRLDRPSIV